MPFFVFVFQIEVQEDQEVTINLFLKKPAYSDNYSLEISLTCSSSTVEKWSVLTGYEEPNGDGEWIQKTHLFHNSAPDLKCTVRVIYIFTLYISSMYRQI